MSIRPGLPIPPFMKGRNYKGGLGGFNEPTVTLRRSS